MYNINSTNKKRLKVENDLEKYIVIQIKKYIK